MLLPLHRDLRRQTYRGRDNTGDVSEVALNVREVIQVQAQEQE